VPYSSQPLLRGHMCELQLIIPAYQDLSHCRRFWPRVYSSTSCDYTCIQYFESGRSIGKPEFACKFFIIA
jgi:hypothetical protein